MPQSHVNCLMGLWAIHAQSILPGAQPPFPNNEDLLDTIDSTPDGNVSWESFSVKYCGPIPTEDPPPWMFEEFEIWYRNAKEVVGNMLRNKDFQGEIDYVPFKEFNEAGNRCYKDLMSGDWAYNQAVSSVVNFNFFAEIIGGYNRG